MPQRIRTNPRPDLYFIVMKMLADACCEEAKNQPHGVNKLRFSHLVNLTYLQLLKYITTCGSVSVGMERNYSFNYN